MAHKLKYSIKNYDAQKMTFRHWIALYRILKNITFI